MGAWRHPWNQCSSNYPHRAFSLFLKRGHRAILIWRCYRIPRQLGDDYDADARPFQYGTFKAKIVPAERGVKPRPSLLQRKKYRCSIDRETIWSTCSQ